MILLFIPLAIAALTGYYYGPHKSSVLVSWMFSIPIAFMALFVLDPSTNFEQWMPFPWSFLAVFLMYVICDSVVFYLLGNMNPTSKQLIQKKEKKPSQKQELKAIGITLAMSLLNIVIALPAFLPRSASEGLEYLGPVLVLMFTVGPGVIFLTIGELNRQKLRVPWLVLTLANGVVAIFGFIVLPDIIKSIIGG